MAHLRRSHGANQNSRQGRSEKVNLRDHPLLPTNSDAAQVKAVAVIRAHDADCPSEADATASVLGRLWELSQFDHKYSHSNPENPIRFFGPRALRAGRRL